MSKAWIKTEISTIAEQDIRIQPTPEFDGIILEFKEHCDDYLNGRLYLTRDLLNTLVAKMNEMMDYVEMK